MGLSKFLIGMIMVVAGIILFFVGIALLFQGVNAGMILLLGVLLVGVGFLILAARFWKWVGY